MDAPPARAAFTADQETGSGGMITVDDLSVAFGGHMVLDRVRFTIGRRERVGLVGRNGSGKTTLLSLLSGDLDPGHGSVTLPRDYQVSRLRQDLAFGSGTVLDEAARGLASGRHGAHGNTDPADVEGGVPETEIWKAEKVLFGLGFGPGDLEKPPRRLSGGFMLRLKLAAVLLSEPDLLLLDEPTNYLDILSIRWLESFLRSWKGELVLVTHDRGFMDRVCTHTMIIHRKKIRKIAGDTSRLYEQIAREEEVYEKTRVNEEKRRREMEQFIDRFRAKARLAGLVQSRIKLLEKKGSMDRLEKLKNLELAFRHRPLSARLLLEARDLCFSYQAETRRDGRPGCPSCYLIEHFNLAVGPRDRIGVVGPNGRGKTTLLRLLDGQLDPVEGLVSRHQALSAGYFGQTAADELRSDLTVEQELASSAPALARGEVMDVAGALLFSGDLAQKKLSVLSGGEKSRVLLGKILLTPVNLLLLDEPTNHLDLEACDSLMAAIDSFPGAVIMVTHNETFLHSLVNRLVVFEEEGCSLFEGGYGRFLEQRGWGRENAGRPTPSRDRRQASSGGAGPPRAGDRRERARIVQSKSKTLKPIQDSLVRLERELEQAESLLERNNRELVRASGNGDGDEIARLSIRNHELQALVDRLYDGLEHELERYERAAGRFNDLLEG
jgi:ATP-binding cassette subfamily F protein 3